MSTWTERVASHPINAEITFLWETLYRIQQLDLADVTLLEDFARIKNVLSYVRRVFDSLDPELLTPSMLEGLHSRLSNIRTPLLEFERSPGEGAVLQANAFADTVLDHVYQLPRLAAEDLAGVREAVTEVRRSMGQHVRNLREDVDSAEEAVTALRATAETLRLEIQGREGRLDQAIARVQDTFSENQAARQAEFQALVQRLQTEWTTEQDVREAEIISVVAKLNADSEAAIDSLRERGSAALQDAVDRWEAHEVKTTEDAVSLIEAMQRQRDEAVKIVGLIAQTGMAGGFQRTANVERKAANVWSGGAAVALVGLVGVSWWFASMTLRADDPSGGIHWETLAAKLVVTLSLAALAGYAGRESAHHRSAERRYRQAELELASLSPFLGDLPENDRFAMLKQFAERFFGHPQIGLTVPRAPQLPIKDALDLIKQTVDTMNPKR